MPQTIKISAHPHPGQAAVHNSPARFKILAAGRRWGKTRLGVNECLDAASRGGRAWWVAPSYKMSEVGWRPVRRLGTEIGAEIRKVDRQIILPGGGEVSVRSADNPDSLRGEGLDLVIMDECSFIKEEAWTEALRPSLADRLGRALFISTPKGHNWFWRLWQRGVAGGEYQSWQFPTETNPYIPPAEIEAAKQSLPSRIFEQEFLAVFVDDAGSVFRRTTEAAIAVEQAKAQAGRQYVMGVDWGKHNDFTVLCVVDSTTKQQVYMDRFNQIDYAVQVGRLQAVFEQFRPSNIIAESNSMGEPIIEQLQRQGLPVTGFQTTNTSKGMIIEALALAFERTDIRILPDPVQLSELQAFEMERLPGGSLRYNAPSGLHDDTVMALALAWHGIVGGDNFFDVLRRQYGDES